MKGDPQIIKDFIASGANGDYVYTARAHVKAGATESAETFLARLDSVTAELPPKRTSDHLVKTKPFLFFLRRVDLIVAFYAYRVPNRADFIAFFADNTDFIKAEIDARLLKTFLQTNNEPTVESVRQWLKQLHGNGVSKPEQWYRLKLVKRYAEFIGAPLGDLEKRPDYSRRRADKESRALRALEQLRERFGDTPFTTNEAAVAMERSYVVTSAFLKSRPELVARTGIPEYVLPNGQHFHRETRAFTFVGNEDALSDDWFDSYAPEGCVSVWNPPPSDQITLEPQLPEECQIRYERIKRQKEHAGCLADALDLGAPGETYVVKRKRQKEFGLPDDGVSDFTGVGLLALRTTKFLAEE